LLIFEKYNCFQQTTIKKQEQLRENSSFLDAYNLTAQKNPVFGPDRRKQRGIVKNRLVTISVF